MGVSAASRVTPAIMLRKAEERSGTAVENPSGANSGSALFTATGPPPSAMITSDSANQRAHSADEIAKIASAMPRAVLFSSKRAAQAGVVGTNNRARLISWRRIAKACKRQSAFLLSAGGEAAQGLLPALLDCAFSELVSCEPASLKPTSSKQTSGAKNTTSSSRFLFTGKTDSGSSRKSTTSALRGSGTWKTFSGTHPRLTSSSRITPEWTTTAPARVNTNCSATAKERASQECYLCPAWAREWL